MTATIMIHGATAPFAQSLTGEGGIDCSSLHFPMADGGYVAVFMPHEVAQRMADAWNDYPPDMFDLLAANQALVTENARLVGFIEEVRDYKATVISGRHNGNRDPQDDLDDMMPLDEFVAFQDDAAMLMKGGA